MHIVLRYKDGDIRVMLVSNCGLVEILVLKFVIPIACTYGTEDATTDDGGARTDGTQPKRQRKDRRPNVLGTVKEEFTEVSS